MTREEQIRQAALKECKSFDIPDKEVRFRGVNSAYGLGFCEGAMWADKTMIEKACEWLNKTLYIHTEVNDTHYGADTIDWVTSDYNSVSDFINDFKKEMGGKNE